MKSRPKNKEDRMNLEKRLKAIDNRYRECEKGHLSLFSKGERPKALEGNHEHFSFRLNNKDRIDYTLGKYVSSALDVYIDSDDIVLLRYIKHDEIARTVKKDINITLDDNFKCNYFDSVEILEEPVCQKDLFETKVYYCSEKGNSLDPIPCLKSKQLECVDFMNSSLIIGGAGSGKTLVLINKLCKTYSEENDDTAYFTVSEKLKKDSEDNYKKISTKNNNSLFKTINEFCIEKLKFEVKDHFTLDDFKKWMQQEKNVFKCNISLDEVWAEIRGCIKGYMGKNWQRTYSFDFDVFIDDRSKKYFIEHKAIKEISPRILKNVLCETEKNELVEKIKNDINEKNKKEKLKYLIGTYELSSVFKYDIKHRLIDFDQYMELSEEFSPYIKTERETLYKIALKYQQHLIHKNKFDDNDLAGLLLKEILSDDTFVKKIEWLFVDEVQDLTELQLFLLSKIASDINHITYSGDIHQMINPTYFDYNRLKSLYKLSGLHIKIFSLDVSYRSSGTIIKLANELAELRRVKIAKKKNDTEQPLKGFEDNETEEGIYKLKYSNENIDSMLDAFVEQAGAVLLVADLNERDRIKKQHNIGDKVDIFTVAEFKGLESEYVFCINITSVFASQWESIFDDKAAKDSKFRYYFNLFYVSITRAKTKLCLCERENVFEKYPQISNLFVEEDIFDEEKMGLHEPSSPDEWYETAEYYESREKYDTAIRRYKKSGLARNEDKRCEAKKHWQDTKFEEAFTLLLEIQEFELANKLAKERDNEVMKCVLDIVQRSIPSTQIDKRYSNEIIAEAIVGYQNLIGLVSNNYINPKIDGFLQNIKKVENIIDRGFANGQQ